MPPNQEGRKNSYWFVDGKIRGLAGQVMTAAEFGQMLERAGRVMDTPQEAREMENVGVRLRHMDELGIDVQVLYPTIFIERMAERPEVEVALCRATTAGWPTSGSSGQGRLRWACVLPLLDMTEALEELEFAQGARRLRRLHARHRGQAPAARSRTSTRSTRKPSRLNMAIGVHIANANPCVIDLCCSGTPAAAASGSSGCPRWAPSTR